jgi:hypothetical protein
VKEFLSTPTIVERPALSTVYVLVATFVRRI